MALCTLWKAIAVTTLDLKLGSTLGQTSKHDYTMLDCGAKSTCIESSVHIAIASSLQNVTYSVALAGYAECIEHSNKVRKLCGACLMLMASEESNINSQQMYASRCSNAMLAAAGQILSYCCLQAPNFAISRQAYLL